MLKDEIIKLRNSGFTYSQICKTLSTNKSLVAYYCNNKRYDIEEAKRREESKIEYEKIIVGLVEKCDNINQVCKILKIRPVNTNYYKINNIIEKYNVDTSHFCIDLTNVKRGKKLSNDEYFVKSDKQRTGNESLKRIKKFDLKIIECDLCKNVEWNGYSIPLEVHHINGDRTDNRLENLQLLCPNCHAQTDNYCGFKNKNQNKNYIKKENNLFCEVCGKKIETNSKSFCSTECKNISFLKKIPKEELINSFVKFKTFTKVGKYYNMSDNGIRKWCVKYDLPTKSKEMNDFLKTIKSKTE